MQFAKGRSLHILPNLWHRITCLIFNLKIEQYGQIEKGKPALYISNHMSYLDIIALGSRLPASFVSKSEVSGWPLIGLLGKLQHTEYIKRKKSSLRGEKSSLEKRIDSGDNLIIFPEGTSTDGKTVIPFKSSLFSLVAGKKDILVQPVTISIISADNTPVNSQETRDIYAWHGDMDFEPHIWSFLKSKGACIKVVFHDPISASEYKDRKTLAKQCHDTVISGLIKP